LSGSFPHRFLADIPGQSAMKEMLFRAIENGRLPSTMLFRGGECLGKFAAALELVRWMKCPDPVNCAGTCHSCRLIANLDHPDIEVVVPLTTEVEDKPNKIAEVMSSVAKNPFAPFRLDKNMRIGIDAIRELNQKIALSAATEGGRWAIVRDADLMTLDAANAFLKTLEEPPENSFIILTSSRPDYLLPTILSRSQAIQFLRLSRARIAEFARLKGASEQEAETLARRADGNLAPILNAEDEQYLKAKALAEDFWAALFDRSESAVFDLVPLIAKNAPTTKAVFEATISFLRDTLLFQTGNPSLIINIDKKERIAGIAAKSNFPKRIARTINLFDESVKDLRFFPQYDLFVIATAISAMKIIRGETI